MKRLDGENNNKQNQWLLAAVLGLLVCLSFYAFLTVLTVLASTAFDLSFWVHPRLFYESFQGNASLLFASLSVYMGFSFFLFSIRSIRLKTKRYSLRSRRRLGTTEFQGRAWVVLYMTLGLCSFSFVGFAFEDFHSQIATEPFIAKFIAILAVFIFIDIVFTFYRLVLSKWWAALCIGLAMLVVGAGMVYYTGTVWDRGKAIVQKQGWLFNTEIDLPTVSFNSEGGSVGAWRADMALVLDSNGTTRAFYGNNEYPLNELYAFFNRHHFRMRASMKVYADKDLSMAYLYELDRETACLDGRVFYYMTQLEGVPEQGWWENYSSNYISMKLRPAECYTKRLPPLPPIPDYAVMDTLFVYGKTAVYKEKHITDAGLEGMLKSMINPDEIIAFYYTEECSYERYLQVVGMVFETAYNLRDAYSLKEFDSLYEDLTSYEDRRTVKEQYPLRVLDLSRMEYHAERAPAEF